MLKLLFITAAISPLAFIPWWQSSGPYAASNAAQVNDGMATVKSLAKCKDAEISVYFHDISITTNSAEHIFDGIRALNNCPTVEFEIVPLISEQANEDDITISMNQAKELQAYMSIVGYNAPISQSFIKDEDEDVSNWRAALLKIRTSSKTLS